MKTEIISDNNRQNVSADDRRNDALIIQNLLVSEYKYRIQSEKN